MTLTEFLLARLTEDEAVAKAASPAPWLTGRLTTPEATTVEHSHKRSMFEFVAIWEDEWGEDVVNAHNDAVHIARHDPAHVLAEVEAKRQLVDLHTPGSRTEVAFAGESFDASECPVCHIWTEDPSRAWMPGVTDDAEDLVAELDPCRTLRLLALPYADHPDYRQEWKP